MTSKIQLLIESDSAHEIIAVYCFYPDSERLHHLELRPSVRNLHIHPSIHPLVYRAGSGTTHSHRVRITAPA